MNLLVLCDHLLTPDRSSGDFRLFQLLQILAADHRVEFCIPRPGLEQFRYAPSERERYTSDFAAAGIKLLSGTFPAILSEARYEVIWLEFYHTANEPNVRLCRFAQPGATIVVDSVDVHFNRLAAKARLTGLSEDLAAAERMRKTELPAYDRADLVIAVSEDDKRLLEGSRVRTNIEVIPNLHPIPDKACRVAGNDNSMLFIGVLSHEPNLDAMLYFCRDIFPLVREAVPDASLTIVGSNPPPELVDLAGDGIEVTGYVPSTEPYLLSHAVSIAPLRFGGGMKGKIGEAMSYGIPVVTTSFGIEGFGLTPGRHLLVADSAQEFSAAVVGLLRDRQAAQAIGEAGRSFIVDNYSQQAVASRLKRVMKAAFAGKPKQLPVHSRAFMQAQHFFQTCVAWRFRASAK
jgi:glycosyltransferase involved in cell wall biosynthesis